MFSGGIVPELLHLNDPLQIAWKKELVPLASHIVAVSHQTKHDLERQKSFTNKLCLERGLSVAKKGHHFDGSRIEQGEITAWSKDKYNLLINDSKKSFVADCAIALLEVVPLSASREEFISGMGQRGWSVQWEDKRKHIVFTNKNENYETNV